MPSVSTKQAKLMAIAANTPGGYDGVPKKVGEEFHEADKKKAEDKKRNVKDMIKNRYGE